MYQFIAATLFTQKKCHLPGLGYLALDSSPAQLDFANTQLLSPQYQVHFVPTDNGEQRFNEFSALSQLMKSQLATSGQVILDGVGRFYKSDEGQVSFEAEQAESIFFQPVSAPRMLRQDATHQVLVGDKSIMSSGQPVAHENLPIANDTTIVQGSRWWLWAIVLFGVAIAGFTLYLLKYANGFLGNMQP
jgi:hypothetical protein